MMYFAFVFVAERNSEKVNTYFNKDNDKKTTRLDSSPRDYKTDVGTLCSLLIFDII